MIPISFDKDVFKHENYMNLLLMYINEYPYSQPNIDSANMLTTPNDSGQDLATMIKTDFTGLESNFKHVSGNYIFYLKFSFDNVRYVVPKGPNGELPSPILCIKQNTNYTYNIHVDMIIDVTITNPGGDTVKTFSVKLPDLKYLQMPIVIGSNLCTISQLKTAEDRIRHGIHPMDKLGTVSLKGSYILQCTRSYLYNQKIFAQRKLPEEVKDSSKLYEMAVVKLISKRDNAFKKSFQVTVIIWSNGSIIVRMDTSGRQKIEIPFYVVYKAMLGPAAMTDRRIVEMIATSGHPEYVAIVKRFVEEAFSAPYRNNALKHSDISQMQYKEQINKALNDVWIDKKDMDAHIYNVRSSYRFPDLFDLEFFLHAINIEEGITIDQARHKKLEHLSEMIFDAVVYANNKDKADTDIYHIRYQSFLNAGHTIARAMKPEFITKTSSKILGSINTMLKSIDLSNGVDAINTQHIQAQLKMLVDNSLANLEKANKGRSKIIESFIRNQPVDVKSNPMSAKTNQTPNSQHSTVVSHTDMVLKQTAINFGANSESQSLGPRMNHVSNRPWICDNTSLESGPKIGHTRWRACTTRCPMGIDKSILIRDLDKLWVDENVDKKYGRVFKFLHIDNTPSSYNIQLNHNMEKLNDFYESGDSSHLHNMYKKIYINGAVYKYFIGSSHKLAELLRQFRRMGKFYRDTGIYVDEESDHVYMRCEMGSLSVPLVIIHKEYEDMTTPEWRLKKLNIKLTMDHIRKVQLGMITSDDLVREGVIEFVSHYEEINIKLCEITNLDKAGEQIYSHVLFPQQTFSLNLLNVSMPNNSYTMRLTIAGMQIAKTTSIPFIFDDQKHTYNAIYVQRPKLYTLPMNILLSSFNSLYLCYLSLDGYNQEDSIVLNKDYIDRGGFKASYFKIIEVKVETNEHPANPREAYAGDESKLIEFRNISNHGIIQRNAIIKYNDPLALISHRIKSSDFTKPLYQPLRYLYNETARVIGINIISRPESYDNNKIIRISLEIVKDMSPGDKGSTNNGCKFTVAKVTNSSPVTANGRIATAQMNGTTVYTRMVTNQVMQQSSRFAYAYNIDVDSTGFNGINPQYCIDAMNKLNPKSYNYVQLTSKLCTKRADDISTWKSPLLKNSYKHDSRTSFTPNDLFNVYHHWSYTEGNMNRRGENQMFSHINGMAFKRYVSLAPTVCIRIIKFATDMSILIDTVPKLRLGEMEFMIGAATCINGLMEKAIHHSDGGEVHVCSVCGSTAYIFEYSPNMETINGRCSSINCTNTTDFYRKTIRNEIKKMGETYKQLGIECKFPKVGNMVLMNI